MAIALLCSDMQRIGSSKMAGDLMVLITDPVEMVQTRMVLSSDEVNMIWFWQLMAVIAPSTKINIKIMIVIVTTIDIIINIIITALIITVMARATMTIITRVTRIHSQTIVCDSGPHTNDAGSATREQNIFNYIKSIYGIVMASASEKNTLL